MNIYTLLERRAAIVALAAGALLPSVAAAQTPPGKWQFAATISGYFPTIGGSTSFPVNTGGGPIEVSSDQIIDSLKMAFMGSLDAHNGRWGGFTDVLYVDVGGSKSQTRDFTIGNAGIPAGTAADLDLDIKAVAWTIAGEWRVAATPTMTMDVLAGARMLNLKQEANWAISGNLGNITAAGRTGRSEISETNWDGIVGVKGRFKFGAGSNWSIPFYADVGTGDSDLTWQAAGGIAYSFSWGELSALWRYLEYNMKSDSKIQDLNTNGPMISATFRW